jgi:hypothetical protein
METSLTAGDLLWEEQQRANRTRAGRERREWLKRFALVLALIVLTLGVVAVLGHWPHFVT